MRTLRDSPSGQILVATVGLPARGKTHLAHAIQRYLFWLGVTCKVFNLANVRRDVLGPVEDLPSDYFGTGPKSDETAAKKKQVQAQVKHQIEEFFEQGGQVAVYDANNSNQKQRDEIRKHFSERKVQIMFIGAWPSSHRMPVRRRRHDLAQHPLRLSLLAGCTSLCSHSTSAGTCAR